MLFFYDWLINDKQKTKVVLIDCWVSEKQLIAIPTMTFISMGIKQKHFDLFDKRDKKICTLITPTLFLGLGEDCVVPEKIELKIKLNYEQKERKAETNRLTIK